MTPAERQRAFDRAVGSVVRERTGLMRATRADLVALLKAADRLVREILAAQPTESEQWSLPRLSAEIRQAMTRFGSDASARAGTAAGDAWRLGEQLVDRPLNAALPEAKIAAGLARLDTAQLVAMRAFLVDRIKDIGVQAANRITTELGLVVIGAQSPSQAVTRVTKILGEESRARATTIVRTELGRAFSAAGQARMMQAAALVPGMQKQWRRSGKLHPRLEHDIIDGQVRDVDKPFTVTPFGRSPVSLMFPRDPKAPVGQTINCGCDSLPFMASWKVKHPGRTPGSPLLDDDGDTAARVLERAAKRAAIPA